MYTLARGKVELRVLTFDEVRAILLKVYGFSKKFTR